MTNLDGTPPNDSPTWIDWAFVVEGEVPELVLQDDGHFLRILRADPLRDLHAGVIGAECDIEMVAAGQTLQSHVFDRLRHDVPQRLLNPFLIRQQAIWPLLLIVFHQCPRAFRRHP